MKGGKDLNNLNFLTVFRNGNGTFSETRERMLKGVLKDSGSEKQSDFIIPPPLLQRVNFLTLVEYTSEMNDRSGLHLANLLGLAV